MKSLTYMSCLLWFLSGCGAGETSISVNDSTEALIDEVVDAGASTGSEILTSENDSTEVTTAEVVVNSAETNTPENDSTEVTTAEVVVNSVETNTSENDSTEVTTAEIVVNSAETNTSENDSTELTIEEVADETIEITQEEVINPFTSKALLGEALFSDTSLSFTRSQSCASCHNANQAFVDTRDNGVFAAVSLGDDETSLGKRNAPMVTYAAFSPAFSQDGNGFIGGQFFDGRASDLTEQAKGPFLNPVEMQMPDVASVIERVSENANYITAFQTLYGNDIFADDDVAFEALADAIATFESSDSFATFDSKLDKVNNGTETLTAQEAQGQQLFRRSRCVTCHSDRGNNALFTDFRYENIGIPKNTTVLDITGDAIDHGLLENPAVTNAREDGKFKTPSLRNVAVTAPYMHNGKFQTLEAVVHFYNTRDVAGAINPETGVEWEASEVRANRVGGNRVGNLGLSDAQEAAIVAFLKTLTDERYEHLNP